MDVTLVAGAAVVVLLALSAFFSSSEIAIFSLSPGWAAERAGSDRRAAALAELQDDPHRLLVTILVGNNVVNVAISSIVTAVLARSLSGGLAVAVGTVVASSLVLVLGEIVPKSYGLGNAEAWALRVVRPLTVVETVLYPLVVVFDVLTRRVGSMLGGDEHIEEPYIDE